MNTTDSFGYWLRRRRLARGLTQRELADMVGCAPATVRKLEADERRPSAQLATRLAEALAIVSAERETFLRAARGIGRVDRLPLVTEPLNTPPALAPPGPHRLPAPPNAFVGRAAEIAAVWSLLHNPSTRLVSLTGPGGTGKTRLALQVATELIEQFPDGVCFVDLAPLGDPSRLIPTILAALGLRERADIDSHSQLVAYLRGRRRLLVIDNFEQLLEAGPQLGALLAAVPNLSLLVTSRFPLRLQAEHEFPVPPLGLPDEADEGNPKALAATEAVQLFLARARATQPGLHLKHSGLQAVAAICRALDGLPLAIELAAARVRIFTPEALLQRISRPLELLVEGARDAPARQRTLRATIDWSYSLLAPDEQALFRRLGAFVGGFDLEAAETLGADLATHERPVQDILAALVERHLVRSSPGLDGLPRFSLLETLREYAQELATAAGERPELRARHAAYYADLGERAAPHFHDFESRSWINRLEADLDNVRAALAWSTETPGGRGLGLALAGAIWWFWELQGRRREGRTWTEQILRDPEVAAPTRERARALYGGAYMASQEHDYTGSDLLVEELAAIGAQLGNRHIEALVLLELGAGVRVVGDPAPWLAKLRRSLAIFHELGDEDGITMAIFEIGYTLISYGSLAYPEEGQAHLEEALRRARARGDTNVVTMSLFKLGGNALDRGDLERAEALLEEARQVGTTGGDLRSTMHATGLLGFVALARGDLTLAEAIFTELLEYARRLGELIELDHALGGLALVAYWRGDPHAGDLLIAEALANPFVHAYPPRQGWLLGLRGALAEQRGDLASAEALLHESLALYQSITHTRGLAATRARQGHLRHRTGDLAGAEAAFRESIAHYHELGWFGVATCLIGFAALAEARGAPERAARLWGAAEAMGAGSRPDWTDCRPDDAPRVAAARTRLATPELAAAWVAGAALTAAEAVAEALAEREGFGLR